jgi:Tfp pilus assembly protein PilF
VAIELARAELSLGGQTQKALARLDAALSSGLSPELERAARKLKAIGEDLEGRHGEAQKIYAQLLIEKDEPSVRFNYGRSLLASRRYSEAVAALRPILDEPRLAQARVVAAAALASQNDKRAAKSLLESYLPAEDIDRLLGAKK